MSSHQAQEMMRELGERYAPVLAKAIDLVSADLTLRFGDALEMAKTACGVEALPLFVEAAVLRLMLQVFGNQKLPGAADA